MDGTGRCVECGAEIPLGMSSDRVCPACLLKLGLADDHTPGDDDPTNTAPPHARPRAGGMIAPGQSFGPYRVGRLLGKGGMGEVYEAEDESGRRVALKVLTHGLDDPDDRGRFLREGRLAASISHPHTVYVYGTDEIEGVPVIAMELAPGGSLKDRVKDEGPLPLAEAVDAILEVIAGLEAAAAGGVLHRDVKPSNCFVDSEGQVKVGDFGLSISTLARAEQDLTSTGTFLGTPAFASPEQLRADDLDVRSDIYSVGATMYYLLTGRPPFEETNAFRLATLVAQERPRALEELRPDALAGLVEVVTRCLAKSPDDRFPTYAVLAKELESFGSTAPTPASAGRRLAAGLIDWLVLGVLLAPVTVYLEWIAMQSPTHFSVIARHVGYILVGAAYFAVLERRSGGSVGKALCGLRVLGLDRSQPGLPRALVRGTFFVLALRAPSFFAGPEAIAPPHPPISFRLEGSAAQLTFGINVTDYWYAGLVMLFVIMRRRNGFSGLHDLLSRTRVVVRSTDETRPIARNTTDFVSASAPVGRVGPYQVVEHLSDSLLLGYDGRLRRTVWIRLLPQGTPALSPNRRDLSRPGRLRWLTGKRAAEKCWDAYEAVEGRPLVTPPFTPRPWSRVRHSLHDLAAELSAGLDDQTIPELALDRVWIAPDGHAKLLDWQAPGVEGESDASHAVGPTPADRRTAQKFLSNVASFALAGRPVRDEPGVAGTAGPLPLSARRFLRELGAQEFQSLRQVRQVLDLLIAGPTQVHRRTRWIHLAICGALPALVWIYFVPSFFLLFRWGDQHPERFELATCVHQLQLLEQATAAGMTPHPEELERIGLSDVEVERIIRALRVYVAQQFRATNVDPSTWEEPFMDRSWRPVAARALAEHPPPSTEGVDDAASIVSRFLENRRQEGSVPNFMGLAAVGLPLIPLMLSAALGLLSAALFRGGLLLRLLGVGVVNASGEETSRARAFVRATIAWSPFVMVGLAVFFAMDAMEPSGEVPHLLWLLLPWVVFVVLPAALLVSIAWSAKNPQRGLQDHLAGTYLVPR